MPLIRLIAFVTLTLAGTGIAATTTVRRAEGATTGGEAAEVARVRRHFDSVLVELGGRAEPGLRVQQQAARYALLATLQAYRDRGVFPHNYDFPDAPTPYFVDRRTGTLCAVAHLLESTGRRDIVDRVARADNNVRVSELSSDSEVVGWLDANGITLAEAARIQVPYNTVSAPEQAGIIAVVVGVPVVMGTMLGTNIWNATGNRDGHSLAGSVLGLVTGGLTAAAGAAVMTSGARDGMRAGSIITAFGGAGTALALNTIRRRAVLASSKARTEEQVGPQTSLLPTVDERGRAGAQFAVRLAF
ncbi:MAG: hypothetical protein H0W68_05910 [Gemmatimonadaceae bacterium]|nr:hypothetical protein [Gemmatimonadaceae bacterium]